jgi:hypothetical protein
MSAFEMAWYVISVTGYMVLILIGAALIITAAILGIRAIWNPWTLAIVGMLIFAVLTILIGGVIKAHTQNRHHHRASETLSD